MVCIHFCIFSTYRTAAEKENIHDSRMFCLSLCPVRQERERDLAIRSSQEELQQRLKEKEEEVRLAIEERELQKMAAVSGLDQQKDDLLQQIEMLKSVSGFIHLTP